AACETPKATAMVGRQRAAAVPDPVFALLPAERVDVEDRAPVRRRLAIGLPRRPAPKATRIVLVLPQIVDKAAALGDEWNLVRRRQHRAKHLAIALEFRTGERSERARVLRLHPGLGAC